MTCNGWRGTGSVRRNASSKYQVPPAWSPVTRISCVGHRVQGSELAPIPANTVAYPSRICALPFKGKLGFALTDASSVKRLTSNSRSVVSSAQQKVCFRSTIASLSTSLANDLATEGSSLSAGPPRVEHHPRLDNLRDWGVAVAVPATSSSVTPCLRKTVPRAMSSCGVDGTSSGLHGIRSILP